MNHKRLFRISFRQLQLNRVRSIFIIIAFGIGVASVVALASAGNGAKKAAMDQIEQYGSNLITINAAKIQNVAIRKDKTGFVTTLKMRDCLLLDNHINQLTAIAPSFSGQKKVKYHDITGTTLIMGASDDYFEIRNLTIEQGNLFGPNENESVQRVAVLGSEVKKRFFGNKNPVGTIILINKIPFEVIGTLQSKGMNAEGGNLDAQIIIPISTALRRVFNLDYLNRIFIAVSERSKLEKTEVQIKQILREAHQLDLLGKEDDFTIDNQITAIRASESSAKSFNNLILILSTLVLFIGGIAIYATMLLSVKTRTSEIGLRISAGARRKDIIRQILLESFFLGCAGGLTGLITGIILSVLLMFISTWEMKISMTSIFISLFISLFTGVIAGMLPACKASKTNPVVALQNE